MPEHDPGSKAQEVFRFDRVRRRLGNTEPLSRSPHDCRVTDRVGSSHEQQSPRIVSESPQPPREALLDARGQRHRWGQPEATAELCRRQPARQLDESERVAVRLDDDPIQHRLVEPGRQDGLEQRARVTVSQRLNTELGQAGQRIAEFARGDQDRDLLCQQAPRDESEARADAPSSHCASSTTHTSGRSSAASDSRPRTASPTRKGFGAWPAPSPKATASASRCGCGRRSVSSRIGAHSCCNAAKGSSISPSTPAVRMTRNSDLESTAHSSNAVLPTPGSP